MRLIVFCFFLFFFKWRNKNSPLGEKWRNKKKKKNIYIYIFVHFDPGEFSSARKKKAGLLKKKFSFSNFLSKWKTKMATTPRERCLVISYSRIKESKFFFWQGEQKYWNATQRFCIGPRREASYCWWKGSSYWTSCCLFVEPNLLQKKVQQILDPFELIENML